MNFPSYETSVYESRHTPQIGSATHRVITWHTRWTFDTLMCSPSLCVLIVYIFNTSDVSNINNTRHRATWGFHKSSIHWGNSDLSSLTYHIYDQVQLYNYTLCCTSAWAGFTCFWWCSSGKMLSVSRSAATAACGRFNVGTSESFDWSIAGGEAGGGGAVWIWGLGRNSEPKSALGV